MAQSRDAALEPHRESDHHVSIRVDSDLVLVPVTVMDHERRPVIGLQKDSFRISEDNTRQTITHFAMEDGPVSVGFVLDTSGSMADKMKMARQAITAFLDTSNSDDEFFLVSFNDHVDVIADLTKDREQIQRQLRFMQTTGRTALLDAIRFSITRMKAAANVRKALIIVSDGGDNCSRITRKELIALVREADVQIFAMGIFDTLDIRLQSPAEVNGPALLRDVTQQSGGLFFQVDNLNQLPEFAAKMSTALRAQYLLGYSPNRGRHDGKYHHVQLKIAAPQGFSKLQAYWRRGYYSRLE